MSGNIIKADFSKTSLLFSSFFLLTSVSIIWLIAVARNVASNQEKKQHNTHTLTLNANILVLRTKTSLKKRNQLWKNLGNTKSNNRAQRFYPIMQKNQPGGASWVCYVRECCPAFKIVCPTLVLMIQFTHVLFWNFKNKIKERKISTLI